MNPYKVAKSDLLIGLIVLRKVYHYFEIFKIKI